jgi:hypothetical protein
VLNTGSASAGAEAEKVLREAQRLDLRQDVREAVAEALAQFASP